MLNDPFPPPSLLYYNNIERDNGTAPWQKEEALIRSLSLGMKDRLDHPAVFFASYKFPENVGGKHKTYSAGFSPSKHAHQQQTHLHRTWSGHCQWGLETVKGFRGHFIGYFIGNQQRPVDRMGIWRGLHGLQAGFETLKPALQ